MVLLSMFPFSTAKFPQDFDEQSPDEDERHAARALRSPCMSHSSVFVVLHTNRPATAPIDNNDAATEYDSDGFTKLDRKYCTLCQYNIILTHPLGVEKILDAHRARNKAPRAPDLHGLTHSANSQDAIAISDNDDDVSEPDDFSLSARHRGPRRTTARIDSQISSYHGGWRTVLENAQAKWTLYLVTQNAFPSREAGSRVCMTLLKDAIQDYEEDEFNPPLDDGIE